MRIIAESEEEKRDIIELGQYLHDFRVYKSPYLGKTEVFESSDREVKNGYREKFFTLKRGDLVFLDLGEGVGNYLAHLYETPDLIKVEPEAPEVIEEEQ